MLDKFIDYWTELNKSGTKMRYELEKTWETSKRLATWASRENDFKKPQEKTIISHEELLEIVNKDPSAGKKYKPVFRENNKKPVYELIT